MPTPAAPSSWGVAKTEREHPRYAHQATVTFHVGTSSLQGQTLNVSRGGLCASTDGPIALGTEVEVVLVLLFEDNVKSEPLRLPARVVWCTELDDANQIGIAFRPLDAKRTEYLTVFLRYLDDQRVEKRARSADVDDRFR